ncbi:MAG TPA: calcium/proton exchanger [Planctomycetota bacterium]|nr:calcium/proton exchanger [Planctomycetota bacterium]
MNRFLKPSIDWLFVLFPVAIALDRSGSASPPVVFFTAALAIVPVASLIVRATEQVAERTGDAIGGLLNATFGNAPELIIAIVAVRAGLHDMVRASLVGAVLANLLLALGVAFFYGGLRHHTQAFNPETARASSTMMLIAAFSMAVPSAFNRFFTQGEPLREERSLNLGIAILLFAVYGLYLLFSLRTHPEVFESVEAKKKPAKHAAPPWSMPRAIGSLVVASVLAAWMSEILVGAAEGTGRALGMSQTFIGVVILAIVGGAAEFGSAVAMAGKGKMDLSVGIALGSCIQISLFVAPILVLCSQFVGPKPLVLSFSRAELGSLFLGVLIGALVCNDGRAHWYKGVQLVTVYVVMAFLFYFLPQTPG